MRCNPEIIASQHEGVRLFRESPMVYDYLLMPALCRGVDMAISWSNRPANRKGWPLLRGEAAANVKSLALAKGFDALMEEQWKGQALLETWMFRITLHVIEDERNQMRRWRRDPSEGAISIAPVSKRREKRQERDVLDPGEIAGEITDPGRELEIRQILDQLSPIAKRVFDLILDGYSPTAAAKKMQREKQWGTIYPAKVLQIFNDLLRECQRSA